MQDIVNAISTVGFPIAMCLILSYEIKGITESHKEETNALKDSYTTEESLAVRVQYLQQHFPKSIAYINNMLEKQ